MPDTRPIGVFDSGLGGLTGLAALHRLLPQEDIVYFGDCARVPYGSKSRETIAKYTAQDVAFLKSQNCKAALCACGTASSVGLPCLPPDAAFPICGVIEGAAKAAVNAAKRFIGVLGTTATIRSGAYETALRGLGWQGDILSHDAPLLVPLVENGRTDVNDILCRTALSEYLAPFLEAGADTLILGCTHYPLLADAVHALAPGVALINPGAEAAAILADVLRGKELLSDAGGAVRFYVSDNEENFAEHCRLFLGAEPVGAVEKIDIERFSL